MKTISKIKKLGKKGFTLTELLAVIAVLSLISVIVVYTAVNVIQKAKDESYQVTIENIENSSGVYVLENQANTFWINGDDGSYLYKCVTVQNLIDGGYFKSDVLDSKVSETRNVNANDYIYLEMDSATRTITKNVLLIDDEASYSGLCGNISASGDISISVSPSGWAKKKDITITYNLFNNVDILSNYEYKYEFNNDSNIKENNSFSKKDILENVTIFKNGTISASINKGDKNIVNKSLYIDKIDNIKPKVEANYNGEEEVRGKVTIPLRVIDNESGIKDNSFTLSDISVFIGNNELNSGVALQKVNTNNYNLVIENYNYAGIVKIVIEADKLFDNVENGNEKIELTSVTFTNKYKINYNPNGGEGSMSSSYCVYGSSCTLKANTFTRTGYKFLGWSTDKNASNYTYKDGYTYSKFEEKKDITLYAIWKVNTVTIKYDTNGGTITSSTNNGSYSWTTDTNGVVYMNGNLYTTVINYGGTTSSSGLANYNNTSVMNISRSCYTAVSGKQWKCLSGCTTANKTFSHSSVYNASDFCDASNGNCTVTVGVNWSVNTYKVNYNACGGSNAPSSQTKTCGESLKLSADIPKKSGYKFKGWSTSSCSGAVKYGAAGSYTSNSAATMYAIWEEEVKTYTVTVKHIYKKSDSEWPVFKEEVHTVEEGSTFIPGTVTPPSGYYKGKDYSYYTSSWTHIGNGITNTNSFKVNQNIIVNVRYYPAYSYSATVTSPTYFLAHTGATSSFASVGYWSDTADYIARYQFTTGSTPASKITVKFKPYAFCKNAQTCPNWYGGADNTLRFYVTTDPYSHLGANRSYAYDGVLTNNWSESTGNELTGYAYPVLEAYKTYYVFVFGDGLGMWTWDLSGVDRGQMEYTISNTG